MIQDSSCLGVLKSVKKWKIWTEAQTNSSTSSREIRQKSRDFSKKKNLLKDIEIESNHLENQITLNKH